jgi:acetylornithine/succinyldiaminopimelate/putrescine aminotransferase
VPEVRHAQEGFWSTYGWHPVATEAAIANLRYIRRHKNAILKNVIETGNYFRSRLTGMKFKGDAQVHTKGLALAVEVEDEKYATRIQEKCRKAGVLISTDAEYVQLFPALTIDRETAKKGLDRLEECL